MSPFNQSRFEALLEGLEVTILPFSEINLGDRADPEYYSKDSLAIADQLQGRAVRPLKEHCTIVASAFYPAATDLYEEGDVPFARCVDVVKHPVISTLQDEKFKRVPQWFIDTCGQVHAVSRGDIILSKVGTPCYASVVHDYESVALSRTVLGLTKIHGVSPYYLAAFLRSKYGFSQLMRERELTIQYQLTLERVREILVYQGSSAFQDLVERAMKRFAEQQTVAATLIGKADRAFTSLLGLEDWQAPEPLSYVRNSAEVFTSGRFDAEHYHEKYFAAKKALLSSGVKAFMPIEEILETLTNGHTPLHHDLTIGEVPFLCAEHVSDFNIDFASEKRILKEHHDCELARTALENGDILLTIKGRVGNAALVENFAGDANINQDVALIRVNDRIPVWYLLSFLNSRFGKMQTEQMSTGAINPFLGLFSIRQFSIPVLPVDKMLEIANETRSNVVAGHKAEKSADSLFRTIVKSIEVGVEETDSAAIAMLKEFHDA